MSMSATIQLRKSGHQRLPAELDPKGEGLVYGQGLPYAAGELDTISRGVGVRPISEFFDDSEMLSDEEYQQEGLDKPQPKWFAAADGLQTLDALIADLERLGPGASLGRRSSVNDILWDLRASRAILVKAAAAGAAGTAPSGWW